MSNWQRWFAIPLSTRWAICVWIVLLLGVFGRVAVARPTAQSVVPVYLMAGERWWNGEPLYAPPPPGLDVYRNPPGFAAFFAPLSQLPPKPVAILWRLINIGLFALGLRRFLAAVNPVSLPPRAEAMVWIVAAFLVLPAFNNGQANLPLVASALLGTAAAVRGHWWQASAWLMFATCMKVYPIALAGLLLLLAPRRLIGRLPLVLLVFLAAPFACQHPGYVLEQTFEFGHATDADERSDAPLERTLKGWTYPVRVWTGACVSEEAMHAAVLISGLALAGLVGFAARRNGISPPLFGLVLCLALLWMALFGPATEMNTYSILAPVGWLLVMPHPPRFGRLFAGIGLGLLVIAVLRGTIPNDPDYTLASLQPIGAFLLLCAGVSAVLKTPHAVAAPTRGEYDTLTGSPRV